MMKDNLFTENKCPTWCNYASLIKDDKTKDAIIAFAACLSAAKEELSTLGPEGTKAAIESASYIAWRSIMGAKAVTNKRTPYEEDDDGWVTLKR